MNSSALQDREAVYGLTAIYSITPVHASEVRGVIRANASLWNLKGKRALDRQVDDITLIASELFANAVEASQRLGLEPSSSIIGLRFELVACYFILKIWDPAPDQQPQFGPAAIDSERGRGLTIVTELCEEWCGELVIRDCTVRDTPGKTVTVKLPVATMTPQAA